MTKKWITCCVVAALPLALMGCARINDMGASVVATRVYAALLIGDQLLQGDVLLYADRKGTLNVSVEGSNPVQCSGQLRYTATTNGTLDLHCNHGVAAELKFSLLSDIQGYAYGAADEVPISLAFGPSKPLIRAYLKPPAGKTLVLKEE